MQDHQGQIRRVTSQPPAALILLEQAHRPGAGAVGSCRAWTGQPPALHPTTRVAPICLRAATDRPVHHVATTGRPAPPELGKPQPLRRWARCCVRAWVLVVVPQLLWMMLLLAVLLLPGLARGRRPARPGLPDSADAANALVPSPSSSVAADSHGTSAKRRTRTSVVPMTDVRAPIVVEQREALIDVLDHLALMPVLLQQARGGPVATGAHEAVHNCARAALRAHRPQTVHLCHTRPGSLPASERRLPQQVHGREDRLSTLRDSGRAAAVSLRAGGRRPAAP